MGLFDFAKKALSSDLTTTPERKLQVLYSSMYDNPMFNNYVIVKGRYPELEEDSFNKFTENKLSMVMIFTLIRITLDTQYGNRSWNYQSNARIMRDGLNLFYLDRGLDKKEASQMSDGKEVLDQFTSSQYFQKYGESLTDEPLDFSVSQEGFLATGKDFFIEAYFAGKESARPLVNEYCSMYLIAYPKVMDAPDIAKELLVNIWK